MVKISWCLRSEAWLNLANFHCVTENNLRRAGKKCENCFLSRKNEKKKNPV